MAGTVELRQAIVAKLERENGLSYALERDHRHQRRQERDLQRPRDHAGAGRRGHHPRAVLGVLSRHGAGLRRHAGHRRLPGGQRLQAHARAAARRRSRRGRAGCCSTRRAIPPARATPPPNTARSPKCWRAIPQVLVMTDDIYEHIRFDGAAHAASAGRRARAARPHAGRQRRLQDLCDDRLAHRLGRRPARPGAGARHAAVAVRRQLLLGQPGGRRRRAERRPELRRRERGHLQAAARRDRWRASTRFPA